MTFPKDDPRYKICEDAFKRGVAHLQNTMPDWASRINLAKLDLSSCTECVIGQLFKVTNYPEFCSAIRAMGLRRQVHHHGFDIPTEIDTVNDTAYNTLTALWADEIKRRQDTAVVELDLSAVDKAVNHLELT